MNSIYNFLHIFWTALSNTVLPGVSRAHLDTVPLDTAPYRTWVGWIKSRFSTRPDPSL